MKAGLNDKLDWFVVQTNPRCEVRAESSLREAGYDVYLPIYREDIVNKRKHTKRTVERPLLVGYLFIGIGNGDFLTLRSCDGVRRILGIQGRPIPVPFGLVEAIFIAEIDLEFDQTLKAQIARGERMASEKEELKRKFPPMSEILVKEGHVFAGLIGEVERTKGVDKVRVLLRAINRYVPVELRADEIEPLEAA